MIYTIDLCDVKIVEWKDIEEAKENIGYVHPDDTYPTRIKALQQLEKYALEDIDCLQIAIEEAHGAEAQIEEYEEKLPKIRAEIRALLTKRKPRKAK